MQHVTKKVETRKTAGLTASPDDVLGEAGVRVPVKLQLWDIPSAREGIPSSKFGRSIHERLPKPCEYDHIFTCPRTQRRTTALYVHSVDIGQRRVNMTTTTSGRLKKMRIVRQEALMERGRTQEGGSSDEPFFRMNFFALTEHEMPSCVRRTEVDHNS